MGDFIAEFFKTGKIETPLAKFNCKFLVYLAKFDPEVFQCVWQILTLNRPNWQNSEPVLAIWSFKGLALATLFSLDKPLGVSPDYFKVKSKVLVRSICGSFEVTTVMNLLPESTPPRRCPSTGSWRRGRCSRRLRDSDCGWRCRRRWRSAGRTRLPCHCRRYCCFAPRCFRPGLLFSAVVRFQDSKTLSNL